MQLLNTFLLKANSKRKISVHLILSFHILWPTFQLVISDPKSYHRQQCGRSLYQGPIERVVGGRAALEGEFPWTVSVHISGVFRCGGSIIDGLNVLTAAHCLQGRSSPEVTIRYNSLSFFVSGSQRNASKLVIHPKYNNQTIDNDIGIIQLKSALQLNRLNSGAICLPTKSTKLSVSDLLTVTGWGLTDQNSVAYVLMAADVPLVSHKKCQLEYMGFPSFYRITNNMICAGYNLGRVDACAGDSGGPLFRKSNGKVYQFGIVSKGFGCGLPMKAGVYTRVENYVDWIGNNKKVN